VALELPTVLFVCVHNAGRSQMAAGLAAKLGGELPKLLSTDAVRAADVVVTMGCGDACPAYPGKRYEDWELEDPAGKDLETVRRIRDEIEARVRALLAELEPDG
jgi:protein-tyrosine-phosphatase